MSPREEADDAIARNLMLFDRLAFELTGLHANMVRLRELGEESSVLITPELILGEHRDEAT